MQDFTWLYKALITFNNFPWMPILDNFIHNKDLSIESNAFLKSMKAQYNLFLLLWNEAINCSCWIPINSLDADKGQRNAMAFWTSNSYWWVALGWDNFVSVEHHTNYNPRNEFRRVFGPSFSQSVCQSWVVFVDSATPLKPLNRNLWNFVVTKDILCRCAYSQEILNQFFFLGIT